MIHEISGKAYLKIKDKRMFVNKKDYFIEGRVGVDCYQEVLKSGAHFQGKCTFSDQFRWLWAHHCEMIDATFIM